MEKTYQCLRWPKLQLGPARFQDGLYTTSDRDMQELIEGSGKFGIQVKLISGSGGEEDEEPPALEEPPKRGPGRPPGTVRARQGSTSSVDLQ